MADELTERGWRHVTVLEQGPPDAPDGATSHAPGLVFRVHPSATMTGFAAYTVRKYTELTDGDGRPCFEAVGGLELATTRERWADLHRRADLAASWGIEAEVVGPRRCAQLWPLLDGARVRGGLHTPGDGLARALPAARAQADRARARGAAFHYEHTVTGIERGAGGVTGVVTDRGAFPADVVVCAAGSWGPVIGALAGVPVPLLPLAHQYAKTSPLEGLDGRRPALRFQDRDLYFRAHAEEGSPARLGIGSYAHRPLPVDPFALSRGTDAAERSSSGELGAADTEGADEPRAATAKGPDAPGSPAVEGPGASLARTASTLPFTPDDFAPSARDAAWLLPALERARIAEGFNGVFCFTPDGLPLLGESRELPGFWLAEAVWVTHSAGVARALAQWLTDGHPATDLHAFVPSRFEGAQLSPSFVAERGERQYVEVYDVLHPLQPPAGPRPLRVSPWYGRQRELGAYFLEAGGWERPYWYEANVPPAGSIALPERDAWSARHWSPAAAVEARAARESAVLYDLTPVRHLEVAGTGAADFLRHLTTARLGDAPGAVGSGLLLDPAGGVWGEVSVTRLPDDPRGGARFLVGLADGVEMDRLLRQVPASVLVRDLTPGTCRVGLRGPRADDLLRSLTRTDLSFASFDARTAREVFVGEVPVTALRWSRSGEARPGPHWELHTTADLGLRLWDTLWTAGRAHGLVAAGDSALESLRLEDGHPAWGRDVTCEHDPYAAGLGHLVRQDGGDFAGRAALTARRGRPAARRLVRLTLDDPAAVVLGSEPVYADGEPAGHVTTAAYGYTLGRTVAYAWLPARASAPGAVVHVAYFGEKLPATIVGDARAGI
ncbi:FAD-dependent oxidoreductase [Streptomyces sp. NPDC003077]|uniref:GcvT family protein n=1 Tax=Streptomyces sp. NPDC003077 TaxID=3154443 RepID=UPI0033BF8C81